MTLTLARSDARRIFAAHHIREGDAKTVLSRLGSVQYDPLNPVGRNHDLVLQARVPGYRVGDWERLAYEERFLYDAWDKQASLVLMQDWPLRRIYHRWHGQRWAEVLESYPEAVEAVLEELTRRGPLTSSAFEFQVHKDEWQGSWYGPKLTKRVLRALWHTGRVVTHSRKRGQHVYDLAERVVPRELYQADPIPEAESVAWLLTLRHRAVGLLRMNASQEVWSLGISAAARRAALARLVTAGELVLVEVEGVRFHALPEVLEEASQRPAPAGMRFLAPLDPFMWDRKAVQHLYGFEYRWEVYVPPAKRRWGYYVLPVLYGDRLVARFDSRCQGGVWALYRWIWEPGVTPDAEMLSALEQAVRRFRAYLGAERIELPTGLDAGTRAALRTGGA